VTPEDLGEELARVQTLLHSVPRVAHRYVCKLCLGPVNGDFELCFGCNRLVGSGSVPTDLRSAIVPITAVLKPSPWYFRLVTYKKTEPRHGLALTAVVHRFLEQHRAEIKAHLGGECTALVPVPSRRVPFESQPLRQALDAIPGALPPITKALELVSDIPRHTYKPGAFRTTHDLRGERAVLVEDTWVTGSTALSAAGGLLRGGAAAVLVMPVARCVDSGFWAEDHPYRVAMSSPWRVGSWPRSDATP
jgi:hypothetical protein